MRTKVIINVRKVCMAMTIALAAFTNALADSTKYTVTFDAGGGELLTADLFAAYYPFDGNLNDISGNGYNLFADGVNSSMVYVDDKDGNDGSALYMNGTTVLNRAATENTETIQWHTNFTVFTWFKPTKTIK